MFGARGSQVWAGWVERPVVELYYSEEAVKVVVGHWTWACARRPCPSPGGSKTVQDFRVSPPKLLLPAP